MKEGEMKTVKVIIWKSGDGNPEGVYRLDERGAGERFFINLIENAETDGREEFRIEDISESEWEECCKRGEEEA